MTQRSKFWNGVTTGDANEAPYNADREFADHTKHTIGATRANAGVVFGTGSEATQIEALFVTQNSPAGMSVLVGIGSAIVDGSEYDSDASETVAIAANASGNARIDTVVLRKSWASQDVRQAILQGTPAASPVPPTLTQTDGVTYEVPLADIAVANGAVSITNANITPRAVPSGWVNGAYLTSMNNNSGAIRQTGDAVQLDGTADRATTVATPAANALTLGAVVGRTAAGGLNELVLSRGIGYVNTASGSLRGTWIAQDASGQWAAQSQRLYNAAGYFLETVASGKALALIDAGIGVRPNYGKLVGNVRAAGGTSITVNNLPQHYPVYNIEFALASGIAATNENFLIAFGGSGGIDATAGNYYSYVGTISNSVAALGAISNLGASAGMIVNAPGSTATSGAFYMFIQIRRANDSAAIKSFSGYYFSKIGNANGNLIVALFGGAWLNTTVALEQIRITTAGANTMAGTEFNIFGKDGITV